MTDTVDLAPAICRNAAQLLEQVWGVVKNHVGKPVEEHKHEHPHQAWLRDQLLEWS